MPEPYRLLIQQIAYDGADYTYGKTIDTLDKFHVACEECPFVLYPESKELSSRNWIGEDGLDEYIPQVMPVREYDITIKFLYMRTRGSSVTDDVVRSEIKAFISYLYGRTGSGETGDTLQNARLAVYSEDTGIGRKDMRIKKVGNEIFYHTRYDDDVVAEFDITFQVNDPVTDVTPRYQSGTFIGLRWD